MYCTLYPSIFKKFIIIFFLMRLCLYESGRLHGHRWWKDDWKIVVSLKRVPLPNRNPKLESQEPQKGRSDRALFIFPFERQIDSQELTIICFGFDVLTSSSTSELWLFSLSFLSTSLSDFVSASSSTSSSCLTEDYFLRGLKIISNTYFSLNFSIETHRFAVILENTKIKLTLSVD